MKKLVLALITLLIGVGASTTAYAGSINANEQEVLNAAQQIYEYNGTKYQLAPEYISQLQQYMMSDDVDLTTEQKNKALASVNSYIEQGVQGGYLVPVGGQSDTGSEVTGTPQSTGEDTLTGSDTNSDVTDDISDTAGSDSSNIGDSKKKDRAAELDKDLEKIFDGSSEASDTASNKLTDDENGNIREGDSSLTDFADAEQEGSIIKDTGYDLSQAFYAAIILGVIMLAGMIVTVRFHFFAHCDD